VQKRRRAKRYRARETGPGSPDNYPWAQNLTTIIDAAGIGNNVWYPYPGTLAGSIVTPYGTTRFTYNEAGVFDYSIRITQADSSQEFYGVIMSYAGGDWPDFSTNQIPANTPIGTLDTNYMERVERNTMCSSGYAAVGSLGMQQWGMQQWGHISKGMQQWGHISKFYAAVGSHLEI
jgi:hypothetical protein